MRWQNIFNFHLGWHWIFVYNSIHFPLCFLNTTSNTFPGTAAAEHCTMNVCWTAEGESVSGTTLLGSRKFLEFSFTLFLRRGSNGQENIPNSFESINYIFKGENRIINPSQISCCVRPTRINRFMAEEECRHSKGLPSLNVKKISLFFEI